MIGKLALASVSLLSVATPVHAQEADEGLSASGEIIVQARRKDESLQEVPLSVQAVSGADLQKLELRTFQDISAVVPGLNLTRATNGIQNTVTLRGVSFDPTAAGPQTAVELYRNDVVTNSAAVFQAIYDVGQVARRLRVRSPSPPASPTWRRWAAMPAARSPRAASGWPKARSTCRSGKTVWPFASQATPRVTVCRSRASTASPIRKTGSPRTK
jgi:hypothetical protein